MRFAQAFVQAALAALMLAPAISSMSLPNEARSCEYLAGHVVALPYYNYPTTGWAPNYYAARYILGNSGTAVLPSCYTNQPSSTGAIYGLTVCDTTTPVRLECLPGTCTGYLGAVGPSDANGNGDAPQVYPKSLSSSGVSVASVTAYGGTWNKVQKTALWQIDTTTMELSFTWSSDINVSYTPYMFTNADGHQVLAFFRNDATIPSSAVKVALFLSDSILSPGQTADCSTIAASCPNEYCWGNPGATFCLNV